MRNVSKYAVLVLSVFALGFAACGDDDDDDNGTGGTGGDLIGAGGDIGGTGGDTGGTGGTGGDIGGTGGDTGASEACETACDTFATEACGLYEDVEGCLTDCATLSAEEQECWATESATCDDPLEAIDQFYGCFTPSAACEAAAANVYDTCDFFLTLGQEPETIQLSRAGYTGYCTLQFDESAANCFAAADCTQESLSACFPAQD